MSYFVTYINGKIRRDLVSSLIIAWRLIQQLTAVGSWVRQLEIGLLTILGKYLHAAVASLEFNQLAT